jgi:hypothetical protein
MPVFVPIAVYVDAFTDTLTVSNAIPYTSSSDATIPVPPVIEIVPAR